MCPTRMMLLSVALVSNNPVYGFLGRLWLEMKVCYYSKALKGGDWSKVLSAWRFSDGGSTSSKRSAWDGWPVGSMGIFTARYAAGLGMCALRNLFTGGLIRKCITHTPGFRKQPIGVQFIGSQWPSNIWCCEGKKFADLICLGLSSSAPESQVC